MNLLKLILVGCCILTKLLFASGFIDDYPELKKQLFVEPKSHLYFGLGIGPIGVLSNRAIHTISPFQLHWAYRYLDFEIANATVGFSSLSKESFAGSRQFIFRTAPKVRLFDFLSIGPVIGYEYISFPNILAVQTQGGLQTFPEPFSASGMIYGLAVCETFLYKEKYQIKISQVFFKETYDSFNASNGWPLRFDKTEIQDDPDHATIKSSFVFLLDVSLLF